MTPAPNGHQERPGVSQAGARLFSFTGHPMSRRRKGGRGLGRLSATERPQRRRQRPGTGVSRRPQTHTSHRAGSFPWDGTWLADSSPTGWAGGLMLALAHAPLMAAWCRCLLLTFGDFTLGVSVLTCCPMQRSPPADGLVVRAKRICVGGGQMQSGFNASLLTARGRQVFFTQGKPQF